MIELQQQPKQTKSDTYESINSSYEGRQLIPNAFKSGILKIQLK